MYHSMYTFTHIYICIHMHTHINTGTCTYNTYVYVWFERVFVLNGGAPVSQSRTTVDVNPSSTAFTVG